MATCDECGKNENMPYQCRHCGGTYCAEHRLPENHACPGLENWNDPGGVFDSGFDASVDTGGRSAGVLSRLGLETGPGGVMGYFRGNMTFVFLGLMWLTFFLEYLLPMVFGFPMYGPTWQSIFVLSPAHPLYVWTWFTAIFAHGGFWHIAMNSIVIYFFGRIVEQYIGSRDFTLLFLVSGVLAGLGQILIQLLQGGSGAGVLGASGAGLAIMGVLTVLNPGLRVYIYFILPVPIWVVTGFYAVISVMGIVGPSVLGGNVANAAHLVGLAIGLAYGQRVKGQLRQPGNLRLGGMGGGPGGPGRGRGPF
ncbi:MAG: rhomboid family intramembrane serine protease [Haloarculaceae archaeon]